MTALWLPIPAIFLIGVNFWECPCDQHDLFPECVLLAMLGALIGLLVGLRWWIQSSRKLRRQNNSGRELYGDCDRQSGQFGVA